MGVVAHNNRLAGFVLLGHGAVNVHKYGNRSQARQNARISSGRPREIRMYVLMAEKGRPIEILLLRKS